MRLLSSENSYSNLKVPRTSATLRTLSNSDIEQHRTSAAGRHRKECDGVTNPKLAITQRPSVSEEMPGITGLLNLRNASHPVREKT